MFDTGKVEKQEVICNEKREYSMSYKLKCRHHMAKATGVQVSCYRNGVLLNTYESLNEAARQLSVPRSSMRKAMIEKRQYNGFWFEPIGGKTGIRTQVGHTSDRT